MAYKTPEEREEVLAWLEEAEGLKVRDAGAQILKSHDGWDSDLFSLRVAAVESAFEADFEQIGNYQSVQLIAGLDDSTTPDVKEPRSNESTF